MALFCEAGTIGAKNQGKGIVGIAPGIGIYAVRVLKADGNGLFSDLLRAYDHLVSNGRSLGVRVVNLSLSGSGDSNDEECGYITQLIAQGMTVVTAAGETCLLHTDDLSDCRAPRGTLIRRFLIIVPLARTLPPLRHQPQAGKLAYCACF